MSNVNQRITPFSAHFFVLQFTPNGPSFSIAANDLTSVRGLPTMSMVLNTVEEHASIFLDCIPSTCLVQFADKAEYPFRSVALCRKKGGDNKIGLLSDTYFYHSKGFEEARRAVLAHRLTPWRNRFSIVYWRGSSTFDYEKWDGSFVSSVDEIPRVVLCERLLGKACANVGISAPWGHGFLGDSIDGTLMAKKLLVPGTSMVDEWSKYRFCLDIDGVSNAWGFFAKLLIGCCVLKIESPYEQWFYGDLLPWRHYVPVRRDLSDLEEKIDWCLTNRDAAEAIADAGQRFAMGHTFDVARTLNAQALKLAVDCDEGREMKL